jgi:GntR family transcriptional regulator
MESGDCYERLREHGVHVSEAVQSIEPAVTNESEAALRQVE